MQWDWRVERVRWVEGGKGVRREREPVFEVRRIGRWGGMFACGG